MFSFLPQELIIICGCIILKFIYFWHSVCVTSCLPVGAMATAEAANKLHHGSQVYKSGMIYSFIGTKIKPRTGFSPQHIV